MIGKTYASADWHGCGKIGKQILDYLQPEDTLYFLGDAMDRGRDGFELFKLLITRPNTVYLKGNHEDMMYKAIKEQKGFFEERGYVDWSGWDTSLWFGNGGADTLIPIAKGEASFKDFINIMPELNSLPTYAEYYSLEGNHKVILEHAGHTPFNMDLHKHDPLWDRDHFHDSWAIEEPTLEQKDTYLVHGHTPVQFLKYEYGYRSQPQLTAQEFENKIAWMKKADFKEDPMAIRYCDGHKFDIDLCTIASKRGVLLDLDTFQEIYFDENGVC